MHIYCLNFREFFSEIVVLLLVTIIQRTSPVSSYKIVSMDEICSTPGERHQLRLAPSGSNSAASISLDAVRLDAQPINCVLDIHVPNTHIVALHLYTPPPPPKHARFSHTSDDEHDGQQTCPLSLFSVGKSGKVIRPTRSVDLCDVGFKPDSFSELFVKHHMTLVWKPPQFNLSVSLRATELIVTAVGVGSTMCLNRVDAISYLTKHFPCWHQYLSGSTPYCIATELICDGRRNCPNEGEDEEDQLCGIVLGQARNDAQQMTESLLPGDLDLTPQSNSTSPKTGAKDKAGESFPEALAHYGPWGYLMLGMLICGTMLMLCGLWECCCRRAKATPHVVVDPPATVFVVGQQEPETPPTYDELDQPPAYNILFPSLTKVEELPTVLQLCETLRTEVGASVS